MVTERVVQADDGQPLAVRDHGGEGPPMLLLHGLGDHALAVDGLAARLVGSFRVVAMDLRWSGRSGTSASFSWDRLVDDTEQVLAACGTTDAIVVGHSLGGIVATRYRVVHPDGPGVVNLDGWGYGDPALYDGMDAGTAAETIESLRQNADPMSRFPRSGDAEWAAGARPLLLRLLTQRNVDESDLDAWADRMLVPVGDGGEWRIRPDAVLYDTMRSDAAVFSSLEELRCPALVLTSDVATAPNEVVAARRRGVAARLAVLSERHPNLRALSIAGSTHESLIRAHADVVADEIRSWV